MPVPPGVPHTPSVHSSNIYQEAERSCLASHRHSKRHPHAQNLHPGHGRDQSHASNIFPILGEALAQSREPWYRGGPDQKPGPAKGSHPGSATKTERRSIVSPVHGGVHAPLVFHLPVGGTHVQGWHPVAPKNLTAPRCVPLG
eukprot:1552843-Amphidinium_carterae.1